MNRIAKLVIVLFVIIAIVVIALLTQALPFNVDFANKVHLRARNYNKETGKEDIIECEITNQYDIWELKRLFRTVTFGETFYGIPACGFGEGVSLTFQLGSIKTVIYPGCDTCGNFRVGEDRYFFLGERNKQKFYKIVGKYGMKFPCV